MGREDRWDQWEAWWGERFEALIAAVREGQQAATPRPLADWPLAQANLPAAGEYPDYMQGTAPEGTDGYLLVNPTGSTIGVWLYAGTPSEGLGRIALIAPPGSMRSIPYGGRGWRVDGALTTPGTGGAPVARLLAIHGPVQTGDGSDTMALTGSLPAGTAQLGTVGLTGQGLPRYTVDQLLVDNVAITVAAGTTYFSASVNLRGLNWMAASVGNVAGTALDYSISVYSYSPLLYGVGGTNNPAIGHQSNSTVSAAGASSTDGNGITVGAQTPTEITQAVVENANTTDALTFSYLEVVGG